MTDWTSEAKGLSGFHRKAAAILARVNGDECALDYVRQVKFRKLNGPDREQGRDLPGQMTLWEGGDGR
jgi:hypothetical protein